MAGLKTTKGKNIMLNRMYKASPDYTNPSQIKVGTGTTEPTVSDTDLEDAVPIGSGTSLDVADVQMTGSDGGENTTDNTTIFKPGAEQTDDTAQNLLAKLRGQFSLRDDVPPAPGLPSLNELNYWIPDPKLFLNPELRNKWIKEVNKAFDWQ